MTASPTSGPAFHTLHQKAALALTLLIGLLTLAGAPAASAQGDAVEEPRLAEARSLYNQAEYDRSLEMLVALDEEGTLNKDDQAELLRLLGMLYTMMGDRENARSVIIRWLDLDPPLLQADPDRDLLEFVRLYYSVRKEMVGSYEVERADPGMKTLAIVDFDNNSIDDRERLAPMSQALADLMIGQLNGATDLQVVERERLAWLMDEVDLSQTNRVDQTTAVRIGKLMGAHAVLFGDYMYFDSDLTVSARLVKVETGEILLTASQKGKLKDFAGLSGKLAQKIAESVESKLANRDVEANTPTSSLDAMLAYAHGQALSDQGQYEAAHEHFQTALDHDPNYTKARQRIESLKPMLAQSQPKRLVPSVGHEDKKPEPALSPRA